MFAEYFVFTNLYLHQSLAINLPNISSTPLSLSSPPGIPIAYILGRLTLFNHLWCSSHLKFSSLCSPWIILLIYHQSHFVFPSSLFDCQVCPVNFFILPSRSFYLVLFILSIFLLRFPISLLRFSVIKNVLLLIHWG